MLQTRRHIARGTDIDLNLGMAEGTAPLTALVLRSSISSLKGIPQYHAAVAFDCPLTILDEPLEAIAEASRVPVFKSPSSELFSTDRIDAAHEPIQDEDSAMIAAFFAISFCLAPEAELDEMFRMNDW